MKLLKNIPNKLFKSKKSRSISRSENPSFGSGTTSSCSDSESHRGFKKPNGLATPTSVLPPSEISADEWSEILQAFHMIDSDGDGKIRKEQLEAILTRVGPDPPSEEELISLLNEVDRNGDGCISLEEFGAISSAFGPPACDDELRNAFDFFDADHDGKITAEELFNVFRTIGDGRCTLDDCRRMIRGVDKNGDGFVCFEDFCLMMEQQR
ncbi:putative calcium-binding protein CML36 [Nicotiana tabacum]|uniref:Calcium-binding protein CML36 n=1 Tax=Nicotiana tabacum TaxID=4097 RepID=A0A1S4CEN0_TOBAC|nr:probable calcium-binding protein CML36 [Nicotiana tomentosiformis]XP_016499615.1 PREDICTED: probable calcium-binding protein CML36 [Nicotiana tabacum]